MLAFALVKVRAAFDRQVAGFGGTRGPNDFAGIRINHIGNLLTGIFDRRFSFPTKGVRARRRIAVVASWR